MRYHRSAGFTIIELMIASTVFAVVLLIVTTGLLQIGRTYYKGVTQSRTQATSRSIIDDLASRVEFSGASPSRGPNTLCIGHVRYSFDLDHQLAGTGDRGLWLDRTAGDCDPNVPRSAACVTTDDPTTNCQELLSPRMRLAEFNATQVGSTNLYHLTVNVVTGEDDLLDEVVGSPTYHKACSDNLQSGTQFCAFSKLETDVQKRL